MKVLVVFAHPKPSGSFNHAILESFIAGLKAAGHSYDVVDLYRIGFELHKDIVTPAGRCGDDDSVVRCKFIVARG